MQVHNTFCVSRARIRREHEAEELRKIPLWRPEGRQLPVVRAEPELSLVAAERHIAWTEVIVDERPRQAIERLPPLGDRLHQVAMRSTNGRSGPVSKVGRGVARQRPP